MAYMNKEGGIDPKEIKYGSESLRHLRYSEINTSGTNPKTKQDQVMFRRETKSSKTARSSKISLS